MNGYFMDKIKVKLKNDPSFELTNMQSEFIYSLLFKEVKNKYGTERCEQIVEAFNNDRFSILKCFISLLA